MDWACPALAQQQPNDPSRTSPLRQRPCPFDGTAQALSPSPAARLNRPTNAESAPRCTCGFASTRTAAHCGRSNNPHRMFQAPISRVALTASPAEIARRSLHHFMDVDNASAPRMKRIKDLLPLGPAGVFLLPCTTAVVLTPRLTGARPIKLTMPRCRLCGSIMRDSAGQLSS